MRDKLKKLSDLQTTIVSNRLPLRLMRENDHWEVTSGSGGLITALAPILKDRNGTWIGWPGAPITDELKNLLKDRSSEIGFNLEMVDLNEDEIKGFYRGFSNEALWPLFHDLLGLCKFETDSWVIYKAVNKKFAEEVFEKSPVDNFIWVHDYQLILVGHYLKKFGSINNSAFFLHIPFPPKDIFIRLPWRKEILEGVLSYRLIGFQTERDRRNFIHCLKYLLPEARISHHRKYPFINYNNNISRIGAFPISIDFRHFNNFAKSREVADAAWLFHEKFPNQKIMLGVDRLDYTKGVLHRLQAFENCLERYPELKGKITLVQLVVPSRTLLPQYKEMKKKIDEMVGSINGRFTEEGWVPIHYIYRTLDQVELLGYYRASEIALITPLKDGMNLVAKEYCAACIEEKGVLILSEFAGAASQLGEGAILVNPYNIEKVADAIFTAYHMDMEEQKQRMNIMRRVIHRNNIFKWVEQFTASFRDSE